MKKVLYVQYTNPAAYPPLEHSSQILARDGWDVLFLGIRSTATADLKFQPHPSIRVLLLPDCAPGWRQKFHYLSFVLWTICWAVRWRPHWIYASDVFACPLGVLLSLLPRTQVVYHEHDLHTPAHPSLFLRLCQKSRKWLGGRADACVLPNEVRAELFQDEEPGANVICVWNCPMVDEISPPRDVAETGDFWLLYHGSVVPLRIPGTVVEALSRLPDSVKLRVVGYEPPGHKGYVGELAKQARDLNVSHRIQFCRSVPERRELLNWCKRSHLGLAFVPRDTDEVNMKNMTGASNKPFDYLASGLALLVTDVADWNEMFVIPGYGTSCDPYNVDSLVSAIVAMHQDMVKTISMGERGRKRIFSQWNYESQFAPVLHLMNSAGTAPQTSHANRSE